MVLPLFGILLVAVNVTVLLMLVTIAKGVAKRGPLQAHIPELTGVPHGLSTGESWHSDG
jgi:hypothetical protein